VVIMDQILSLAKEFGPFIAGIGFFIWWGYQREARMSKALDEFQARAFEREQRLGKKLDDQRMAHMGDIKSMNHELKLAVENNTKAFTALEVSLTNLRTTLEKRPCILPEVFDEHERERAVAKAKAAKSRYSAT